jgi:hypothetical protein
MKYNYEKIKAIAKQAGAKVTDLLALAPQNDPFYTGTPTDLQQANWFAEVWKAAGYTSGVHLRRVHYWAVSQHRLLMHNGEPYLNTDKCWGYLTQASKMARYMGYVQISDIADNKNPEPHSHAEYYANNPYYEIVTPDLSSPNVDIYGIHNSNIQPYHLEIWCEKSTMNDVLLPLCEQYRANLVTFEGEVSITACYNLVRRINQASKPCRVFYISDFDPAGKSMPVAMSRKIEYMLGLYSLDFDVRVKALVLTLGQVHQYQLPRTPIKETERRATSFEGAFGTGAVELDALEALYPNVLAQIVQQAISPYYSAQAEQESRQRAMALEQAVQVEIDLITARYQSEIAAVRAMLDEIEAIDIDAIPYAVNQYPPHVSEDDNWLFNSRRDYVEQIGYYKEHGGKTA